MRFLDLVEAPEPFAVAEIVLAGFLRIVTNPKIFRPAMPMQTALAFCRRLVEEEILLACVCLARCVRFSSNVAHKEARNTNNFLNLDGSWTENT